MQTVPRFKLAAIAAFAAASILPACALAPTSGPTSTVVYVSGDDLVLKASDGKILNYIVPMTYKFSTGGKQVTLSGLAPGAMLTAPVATGSDPLLIASIATMKAKVYATAPPDTLTLTTAMGAKDFTVPDGTKFMVAGKALDYKDLASDVMLDVTVVTPAAEGADAPPPATPPMMGALLIEKSDDLPSAGTNLPLYGLIGLALMTMGFVVLRFRKNDVAV
jgi:LPXTG-motif cell wall-anchored protein